MPTYSYTQGAAGFPAQRQKVSVVERILDFAAIAAERAAAGQLALAADDILQVFPVQAGTLVLGVASKVITPEGETATFDVGDGATVDGFIDGANANQAGWHWDPSAEAFSLGAGGKFYTTDDTIDMKLLTAVFNVAKIKLVAIMVDCRGEENENA